MIQNCVVCGEPFESIRKSHVCCSRKCRDKYTKMKKPKICLTCGREFFTDDISLYCSKECKNKDFNENKRADYSKERGTVIRLYLIQLKGGKCEKCGYNKNISALNFHHINPELKSYEIDQRSCANRSLESLIEEANKC